MPKDRKIDFALPELDDIFSTQEERDEAKLKKIHDIPLDQIDPFPDHPFQVRDDEDMMNLVDSVLENGIITPAMVRKKEDGRYENVSGHRRYRACQLAGIDTLRAEVVDMTRDEAIIAMVESNFQRSEILPSEKAFAYKMRLEAMNRQGKRTDLTSDPVGRKLAGRSMETAGLIGAEAGDSQTQVKRYIRLTNLTPELLQLVDDRKIGLRPAVELSYIPEDLQESIYDAVLEEQCTPTHAQAIRMRKMNDEGNLTMEAIEAIMMEEKPNQKERIVLRGDRFRDLFPKDLPISKREDYVAAAMEYYNKHRQKVRDQRDER